MVRRRSSPGQQVGGCQTQGMSHSLPASRGHPLQKILYAPTSVPVPTRRSPCSSRDTQRMLWSTRRHMDHQQGPTSRVLLAYHETRRKTTSGQMREVSKTLLSRTPARITTHHHAVALSLHTVGYRHCRSFPSSPRPKKVFVGRHRLFYQMSGTEPLARITEGEVMKLIWKNIVCRFGVPREIISDNGRQFQGRRIQEWCQGLHIKQRFTSVAHPQSNGQVEVTNRILVQGIKRRLERVGENWTEELTNVLWAYRTTPRGSTGESPFSLVYGTKAIIPAELRMPSHRVMNFSEECNTELLKESLDLIEELREKAFIRVQRYKNTMINSYNKRVKARSFQVGDLVLRRVDTLKPVGKLDPTWEGPYKVTGIIGRGAYELEDLEGRPLPRPWNIHNIKKYCV
ncbi:UNVERIFIED_CONTAM: hypothetical protein Slati_2396300 [Sesamum latifolium]|uniref:Integrase catalytic domain-containing protein n=1 Tax=Sesamum latifolium TaxID=2727402 RepID=A0AAW2WBZ9_9LAMI